MSFIPKVLIIAGSDSGGGAGIQADIKSITYFKGYAMTAVTAITAQNTKGVQSIYPLPKQIVIDQINSVTSDLMPDIIKIGMLADEEIIDHISSNISNYKIILDPVMVATSGDVLVTDKVIDSIKDKLINKSCCEDEIQLFQNHEPQKIDQEYFLKVTIINNIPLRHSNIKTLKSYFLSKLNLFNPPSPPTKTCKLFLKNNSFIFYG